jgi:hypothetical protein
MTTGRADATATLLGDGRVLLAGGDNPSGLASAELYDPTSRTWSATGSMTAVHIRHAAVLLQDGRVLVAGDAQAGDVYSPATGTWAQTGPMVNPYLLDSAAALLPDGHVLYAGGHRTICSAGGEYCYDQVSASAELYTP